MFASFAALLSATLAKVRTASSTNIPIATQRIIRGGYQNGLGVVAGRRWSKGEYHTYFEYAGTGLRPDIGSCPALHLATTSDLRVSQT
ncbi:hypothetical protein V8D89_012898 [Ganoderma adspersum]